MIKELSIYIYFIYLKTFITVMKKKLVLFLN